jgi:hypothetical protein
LNGNLITITNNSLASELTIKGSNQTIVNNSVEGGFECQGFFNTITGNMIASDMTLNGSFNLVNKNSFRTVYLEKCDSNTISGNSLKCLWLGWQKGTCFNNSIIKNKITGPGTWGILMGAGSYNLFHSNLIINFSGSHSGSESHYGYGIAVGGTHTVAEHNIFYHNILKDNYQNVGANWEILGAGNYWDNGKEGNYWDDYTGPDNNGDTTRWRIIYTFYYFVVACCSSRISFKTSCFRATLSWCSWRSCSWLRLMMVALGLVKASFVKISSGLRPHAFMISLRASILLTFVFGLMHRADAE